MTGLIILNIHKQTSSRPTRFKKSLQVTLTILIILNVHKQTLARPTRLKKNLAGSIAKINHPQCSQANLIQTYKVKEKPCRSLKKPCRSLSLIIGNIGCQPSGGLLQRHPFPRCEVGHLVFLYFAHPKITSFRIAKIIPTNTGSGPHGQTIR